MAENFHSQKLFRKQDCVKLSYTEAAALQKVCRRTCITHLQRDVENGYLRKQSTIHRCARYSKPLHGRNIFSLTKKGRESLGRQVTPKESRDQAEQATNSALRLFFASSPAKSKEALQKLQKVCPPWWLENKEAFAKTLSLLQSKMRKGYRVRSPARWISATIKDLGIGFQRRQARRLSSDIQHVKESSRKPSNMSPYALELRANLKTLAKKGAIDFKESTLIRLSRKGTSHLALAARVFLRIDKKKQLKNPARFFNWLLTLKDPNDAFKRKETPPEDLLDWTKEKLRQNKNRCIFLSSAYTEPKSKDPSKTYVYFGISRKNPLKSYLRVFFFRKGLFSGWQEACLSLFKPTFKEEFFQIFPQETKPEALHGQTEKHRPFRDPHKEKRNSPQARDQSTNQAVAREGFQEKRESNRSSFKSQFLEKRALDPSSTLAGFLFHSSCGRPLFSKNRLCSSSSAKRERDFRRPYLKATSRGQKCPS